MERCIVNASARFFWADNNNNNNINNNKNTDRLLRAVCGCGWLIINASVEGYGACQVYESSLSSERSQSDSHSALNIKC